MLRRAVRGSVCDELLSFLRKLFYYCMSPSVWTRVLPHGRSATELSGAAPPLGVAAREFNQSKRQTNSTRSVLFQKLIYLSSDIFEI